MTGLKQGDKVAYIMFGDKLENGIIKSISGEYAFVVYKCGEDWDNYMNYTGARTKLSDLIPGWCQG